METQYFANLPADRLVTELASRVDSYYNWLQKTGRLVRWRTAYNTYYSNRGQHSGHEVTAAGDKGELSFLMSNEYRNLVQHLMVMAMQSRPSLETVAENTDSASKASSYVAKGIVEYYRRHAGIDQNTYDATEIALIMDTGWVFNEWDISKGDDIRPNMQTGQVLKTGDVYSRARTPLDVIVDFTKIDRDRDWIIVRDPVNKFDVAAQYPEKATDILAISRDPGQDAQFKFGDLSAIDENDSSSDIYRYTFYHRKTPACSQGRMLQFYANKCWTFSGPMMYRKLPGNRICPTEQILSGMGYSNMNALLSLQDVMDALISSGVTNMTTLGVNNIWVKSAENFDFEQVAQGMNVMEGDEKPEVLQMNKLSPEWFSMANFVIGRMEALSGVNAVARGNLQGKDLSGAAMALLQSMSIQFNTGLQRAVNGLIEDNGNDIIMLTQDFAAEERLGMIVGKNNRYMMKKYRGKDLKQIRRVFARQSNPLKDTTAGKLEIARDLIQMQAVKSPQAYMEVLETGNLDVATETDRNERLTVDEENEAIMMGMEVPVMFTDNHPEHLVCHRKLLFSPEDRQDAALIERVRKHYDEHMAVWKEYSASRPDILIALGIPVLPPTPPIDPATGLPLAPPPPGAPVPPPGPGAMPPGAAEAKPPQAPMGEPAKPEMPVNPLTGNQFNPLNGGQA